MPADDPERIIDFWRVVEIFSPQKIPDRDAKALTVDLEPGDSMPWEPGSRRYRRPDRGKVWRHVIFGGVFDLQRASDTLAGLYAKDDEGDGQRERVAGQSALFSSTVDGGGRVVEGSALLSSCAWAVGRVFAAPEDLSLTGFVQDAQRYGEGLAELAKATLGVGAAPRLLATSMRAAVPDALESPSESAALDLSPLTGADLHRFTAQLAKRLGVVQPLQPRGIRVRSYQVDERRGDDEPDQSFLSSFYAEDLARVRAELRRGRADSAIRRYLAGEAVTGTGERKDVRAQPWHLWDGCVPGRIPPGRWPSNGDQSLALSQQFAVNTIMMSLGDRTGILAVNGPPGTGKTTMLRDLVAAIVVERATRMANLPNPAAAFSKADPFPWRTLSMSHSIAPLAEALTGMEMVVASSNNGAVENVTTEIPGPGGIGGQWEAAAADVDYFTSTARLVHGEGAWAMIAARLGNRANCRDFLDRFWWGRLPEDRNDKQGPSERREGCMVDLLARLADAPSDWAGVRANFLAAREEVKALAAERSRVAAAISCLRQLSHALSRADEKEAEAQDHLRASRAAWDAGSDAWHTARELAEAAVTDAAKARHLHRHSRPGVIVSLSTWFRAGREWHDADVALRADCKRAEQVLRDARAALSEARQRVADSQRVQQAAGQARRQARADYEQVQVVVTEARRRWGDHVPDGPEFLAAAATVSTADANWDARRELTAPWADEEFAAARSRLFLAALALHKAFIAAEAGRIRGNLSALADMLTGRGKPPDQAAVLAAWQAFFLVVPVVSTTFASLPVMFSGLGPDSLGWLFIDEAGQAAPQQAVGAIWRAKRTVVVGDPRQLEPVVMLPWAAQRALADRFRIRDEWAPAVSSVQVLADRLTPYGTSLPGTPRDGSGKVWVGTPLRVHRRCDNPMFMVSNEIAYDGMMIYGTPGREQFPGGNYWYDIRSAHSEGHWLPAEGERLAGLLSQLRKSGTAASQIRVISPFKQVIAEAKRMHSEVFPEVRAADRDQWVKTVHKMQGKEANVVVLILGGDPRKPGAKAFATGKPNLLNVAVTRARRRLYVIGNLESWGNANYFSVLARHLESYRAPSETDPPRPGTQM